MSWNYKNITGDYWNVLPLDEQLDLLKKHYPIGIIFDLDKDDVRHCKILDHVKCFLDDHYSSLNGRYIWITKVEYLINGIGSGSELRHPGFLIPDKETIREIKIQSILI